MTHTRLTTPDGLRKGEITRLDGDLLVRVEGTAPGALTYRGASFQVVYVQGFAADGPVRITVLGDRVLIAAS